MKNCRTWRRGDGVLVGQQEVARHVEGRDVILELNSGFWILSTTIDYLRQNQREENLMYMKISMLFFFVNE